MVESSVTKGGGKNSMIQITLEAARVNANMTQDEAAAKLGVNKQTIVNWEKGRTSPTMAQGRLIESVYGIPLANIFFAG